MAKPHSIETGRLRLVAANATLLKASIAGDKTLARLMGVSLAQSWTQFGPDVFKHILAKINAGEDAAWWMYFPVLKEENIVVGTCGFKGAPTGEGLVEIGYEIAPNYRRQGLATDIVRALLDYAFSRPNVSTIAAHTMSGPNASARVLEKAGLKCIAQLFEQEESQVWRWEIDRKD